jgi:Zinc dependent phospholipase C
MIKFIIALLFISNVSFAAGVTSHRFMSKKSLDYIKDTGVRDMLKRNFGTYMAATMLPDMGYLIGQVLNKEAGWWGEEVHWAPFLNWMWTYNQGKCKSRGFPPSGSSECEFLWTTYFGILSHALGDIQWHGGYIYRFAVMEAGANSGGPFSNAHTIADNMGDLPAVHYYGERSLNGSLNFDWTLQMLNSFARSKGKPDVNRNYVTAAFFLQEAWYTGIKVAWPVYYYFKLKYKWGHDNYLGTLGGIDNTARRIAESIDMVSWDNRNWRLERITNIATGGNWPHNFFKLTKSDNTVTVDRAYHEPSYQLSPAGTYDCRWGLYLGGWRWFSYGDVSRCPFQATSNYQKSQCERYRYWPLSCKKY